MIIWLHAQLSPALAPWIQAKFGVETLLSRALPEALVLLEGGEQLVEISAA